MWYRVNGFCYVPCPAGLAALEPIGAAAACSEGHVYGLSCFIDSAGYIADVQYSTTVRNTPVSLCNAQDWQLQAAQLQAYELSPSDYFVSFRACSSTSGGLRGLAFLTSLGAELTCGSLTGSSCRRFSSRSTYPLRGMQAACQTHSTAGPARGDAEPAVSTRVSSITAACWVPKRSPSSQGGQRFVRLPWAASRLCCAHCTAYGWRAQLVLCRATPKSMRHQRGCDSSCCLSAAVIAPASLWHAGHFTLINMSVHKAHWHLGWLLGTSAPFACKAVAWTVLSMCALYPLALCCRVSTRARCAWWWAAVSAVPSQPVLPRWQQPLQALPAGNNNSRSRTEQVW
jgi:hypothetical protein